MTLNPRRASLLQEICSHLVWNLKVNIYETTALSVLYEYDAVFVDLNEE
jgi:hypothetical protein